jgi:predicted dehydrogenase
MFDMGPYYLTALLNLLGPVRRITGLANIAIPDRTITSQPKHGTQIQVQTPDQVFGLLEFQNGVTGTLLTSFATKFRTYDDKQPITLYGTAGTLRIPDPNQFDGPVHIKTIDDKDWREVPPTALTGYSRATGLADLAHAIRSNRPARCDLTQAFTVLDLMQGFLDSSATGQAYQPHLPYTRPAPMPTHLPFGTLDD